MHLNDIESTIAKETTATKCAVQHSMNYTHNNPNAQIIFQASNIILHTESDSAYLVALIAQSCAAGYHYCGSHYGNQFNGPIHVLAKVIKNSMESVMESEIAALYINTQLVTIF